MPDLHRRMGGVTGPRSYPATVRAVVNRITGTTVRLHPPAVLHSAEGDAAFMAAWEDLCAAGWRFARLDPQEVTAAGLGDGPSPWWPPAVAAEVAAGRCAICFRAPCGCDA